MPLYKFLIKILIFILISTTYSCTTDMKEINALTQEYENMPMLTVHGLKLVYSSNAKLQIQLTSAMLQRYQEKDKAYIEFPQGCKINFYNDQAEVESSLKADTAIYHEKTQNARVAGNVVITNTNGSILRSEELFLKNTEQKIYSIKPVTITYADGSVIQGDGGFESNLNFTVYRFKKVTGIQNITKEF